MDIIGIYNKGYAPATSGGVIFNLAIEVPNGRFNFKDKPFISVLVENRSNRIEFRLISRSESTKSFWGEEEKLVAQELAILQAWAAQHRLIKEAKRIVAEDRRLTKELDMLYADNRRIYDSPKGQTLEESLIRSEALSKNDVQIEKLYKEREGLKYIKVLEK